MKQLDCNVAVYAPNGELMTRASEYYTKRYQAGLRSPLKGQTVFNGRKVKHKYSTETTIIIELQ
jgi:hypothetical protein